MALVNQSRYSNHTAIIKEKFVLHVDSRNRDTTLFPNQNEYRIRLPAEYRGVYKISMLTQEFQSTHYAIDSTNNQFAVAPSGVPFTPGTEAILSLKEGTYTGSSFNTELASTINVWQSGTSVNYDADTRKLSFFQSAPGFQFLVASSKDPDSVAYVANPMWEAMGLNSLTVDTDMPFAVGADPFTAPETIKIDQDRYLIMNVTFPRIFQGRMQSTGNHRHIFAKILFDSESSIGDVYDFVSAPVSFDNLIRINYLGFRFERPNGDLYDFHNQEHSFTLEFISHA